MTKKRNILLGTISVRNQKFVPYPVGCLISHCQKNDTINKRFNFLEPLYHFDQAKTYDFTNVDILGLTNYIWNQLFNDKISKIFKEQNPSGLVIYGGPNVPETMDFSQEYMMDREEVVDVAFPGPSEKTFEDFLLNIDSKQLHEHEFTIGLGWHNYSSTRKAYAVPDSMPTPYTDGIFEKIIEKENGNLAGVVESNRGCPYQCAFCDWGAMTRAKVQKFDQQDVFKTIEYIADKKMKWIVLGDANTGMLPEDVELVQKVIDEKRNKHPNMIFTFAGLAKNPKKHAFEVVKLLSADDTNANKLNNVYKSFRVGIQSHHPDTLDAVSRHNIKPEELIKMAASTGSILSSELITGLPGEKVDNWFYTLEKEFEYKMRHSKMYPLHTLHNTQIYSKQYMEEHEIELVHLHVPDDLYLMTKKMYEPHFSGKLALEDLKEVKTKFMGDNFDEFEYSQIHLVRSCKSFSLKDLEEIHQMAWWHDIMYNTRLAREWMYTSNMSYREQYDKYRNKMEEGKMPLFKRVSDNLSYVFNDSFGKRTDNRMRIFTDNIAASQYPHNIKPHAAEIYLNLDQAIEELNEIYDKVDYRNIKEYDEKKCSHLYSMNAMLRHHVHDN